MEHLLFNALQALGIVFMTLAVILFVMLIGTFLGFVHPDPEPFEEEPMATGTVTKIIWPNNLAPGEVQDHATNELILVPFSAVTARGQKLHLPFQVGTVIQYDILLTPGKHATNVRPVE